MKGVKHYRKDGTVHKGGTHKMPDGSLHSGKTHGKNIAKGKMSAAYWADKEKW